MFRHNKRWWLITLVLLALAGAVTATTQISLDSPATLPSDI